MPPLLVVVLFGGFRQHLSGKTGVHRLYVRLADRYHDRRTSLIAPRRWNDKTRHTADQVREWIDARRREFPGREVFVVVIAHSYGAGRGLLKFARHLYDHGVAVSYAFIIDGVKRWQVFKWFSLTRWFRLTVPAPVKRVMNFRQVNERPYGHAITTLNGTRLIQMFVYGSHDRLERWAVDGETRLNDGGATTHYSIDNSEEIHDRIQSEIDALVGRRIAA